MKENKDVMNLQLDNNFILTKYIEAYFQSKDYNLELLKPSVRKDIEDSFVFVQYSHEEKKIEIIPLSKDAKGTIVIDLKKAQISGKIVINLKDLPFKVEDDILLSDLIYNVDLINKILVYTPLVIKGKYTDDLYNVAPYALELSISEIEEGVKTLDNTKLSDTFSNQIKFTSDLNIRKNLVIDSIDKFMWVITTLKTLEEVCEDFSGLGYVLKIKNIALNDEIINSLFEKDEERFVYFVPKFILEDCSICLNEKNKKLFTNKSKTQTINCTFK